MGQRINILCNPEEFGAGDVVLGIAWGPGIQTFIISACFTEVGYCYRLKLVQ
ncbi:hypothetical protein PATSB16_19150 [Pandoraea thiooxydans]|nr:hypothetical protein PATSB16_19150 [Pandoraea thiooxydans]